MTNNDNYDNFRSLTTDANNPHYMLETKEIKGQSIFHYQRNTEILSKYSTGKKIVIFHSFIFALKMAIVFEDVNKPLQNPQCYQQDSTMLCLSWETNSDVKGLLLIQPFQSTYSTTCRAIHPENKYVTVLLNKVIWRHHHYRWRASKFRPMLGAQGLWSGRDLYRATPDVTRGLGFSGLIRRTAPFSRLLRHEGMWRIYSNLDPHGGIGLSYFHNNIWLFYKYWQMLYCRYNKTIEHSSFGQHGEMMTIAPTHSLTWPRPLASVRLPRGSGLVSSFHHVDVKMSV
jgi:hypothetical protein